MTFMQIDIRYRMVSVLFFCYMTVTYILKVKFKILISCKSYEQSQKNSVLFLIQVDIRHRVE